MARCGCNGTDSPCACAVVGVNGVKVAGVGSSANPYEVSLDLPGTRLYTAQYECPTPTFSTTLRCSQKNYASVGASSWFFYNPTSHDVMMLKAGWYFSSAMGTVTGSAAGDDLAIGHWTGTVLSEGTIGQTAEGRSTTGFARMRATFTPFYVAQSDIDAGRNYLRMSVRNNSGSTGTITEARITVSAIESARSPVVQAAHPSTLADVIAVLQANGFVA